MSAGDADIVREMYEAFNRGEYEAATAMLHESVELDQGSLLPDTDVYVGTDEFVRGLNRWLEEWEPGFQFLIEDMTTSGERPLMRIRLRGRGRASGVELEQVVFHVWEVRDGRPFRCQVFWSERRAREAAGLGG